MVQWSGAVLSSSGCMWQTGSIMASSTRKMLVAMVTLPIRPGEFDCIVSRVFRTETARLCVYQHYNESAQCGWMVQARSKSLDVNGIEFDARSSAI